MVLLLALVTTCCIFPLVKVMINKASRVLMGQFPVIIQNSIAVNDEELPDLICYESMKGEELPDLVDHEYELMLEMTLVQWQIVIQHPRNTDTGVERKNPKNAEPLVRHFN